MSSVFSARMFLTNFFNPAIATKQLHDGIKQHREKFKLLKKEYDNVSEWNRQYIATLSMLTDAIQAMIWKKDKHNRYLLANPDHCKSFFGFDGSPECLAYVIGKTDQELIDSLYTSNIGSNTFQKVCPISDDYCSGQKEPIHFLEAGRIDEEEVLLYVIKTPQFTNTDEFIGTIGMAWDVTSRSSFLTGQLNRWIYDKLATKIYHDKDVFCYAILPEVNQCGLFKHICPNPHIEGLVQDNCNLCDSIGGCHKKEK